MKAILRYDNIVLIPETDNEEKQLQDRGLRSGKYRFITVLTSDPQKSYKGVIGIMYEDSFTCA